MYRIGYIDDEPTQYENYKKKLSRRFKDVELILFEECVTKDDFVDKIYETQSDVLLIDYKMAKTLGFNGSTLISYINDQVRDLECFILTAVDQEEIVDGLIADRNIYSKTIFDTEGDTPEKVEQLEAFIQVLKQSADVFRIRREQKKDEYKELFDKKKISGLTPDEEEKYLNLYKVLSSYGMVEKVPANFLKSDFEERLNKLLETGNAIIEKYEE